MGISPVFQTGRPSKPLRWLALSAIAMGLRSAADRVKGSVQPCGQAAERASHGTVVADVRRHPCRPRSRRPLRPWNRQGRVP